MDAIIQSLKKYKAGSAIETEFQKKCIALANEGSISLNRMRLDGHFTASAWVVNKAVTHCLLLHHHKLGKWLQPGGHADGEADLLKVASKELAEETGIKSTTLLKQGIFDIDIHTIPARKDVPQHLHYDIRYIFVADGNLPIQRNHESNEVKWISFYEADALCQNDSISRMIKKSVRL